MNSGHFVIYRTSAGSGKTFTLALKYIETLFRSTQDDYHRHIVAITFTNKATAEMKERILRYLFMIWQNVNNSETERIVQHLQHLFRIGPEEIAQRCGVFLKNILHQYSRFYVSTIDSFFSRIVRTFQHDLNLPDGYQIQIDQELVVEHLLLMFYQSLQMKETKEGNGNREKQEEQALLKYVQDLVLLQMEEEGRWNIDYLLSRIIYRIFSEEQMIEPNTKGYEIEQMHAVQQKLWKKRNELREEMSRIVQQFVKLAENANLKVDDFPGKSRGLLACFSKINDSQQFQTYQVMFQCLRNDYKWGNIDGAMVSKFKNCVENYLRTYFVFVFCELINRQFPKLALLGYFRQLLREYQHKHQQVVISEIGKIVAQIVQKEPMPYIYERYGERFHHYFIDEFQDTSVLQWMNFLPLVHESLSKGNYVMLFGDAKQSIYRFRNSEVELFLDLPALSIVPLDGTQRQEIENKLKQEYFDLLNSGIFRNVNYRSLEAIVSFNNKHFRWIADTFGNNFKKIAKAYEHLEQDSGRKIECDEPKNGIAGIVKLYPIQKAQKGAKKEIYSQLVLQCIYDIIMQKKAEGYHYRDITVLIRSNADCQSTAQYLLQRDIPVISVDSLALHFSADVRLLVNLMRLVDNACDNIAAAAVLSYIHTQSAQIDPSVNLENYLEQHFFNLQDQYQKLKNLEEHLNHYFQTDFSFVEANIRSADSLLMYLLEKLKFQQKMDQYVLTFYEQVMQFIQNNRPCSLRDILVWWDKKGKNISVLMPEGVDAVQVMTIHKAKGLQFPIVIYPFADYRLLGGYVEHWFHFKDLPEKIKEELMPVFEDSVSYLSMTSGFLKNFENCQNSDEFSDFYQFFEEHATPIREEEEKQRLDTLNIHYVAMTRAMNELHVIFTYKDKENSNKKSNNEISDIGELLIQYVNEHSSDFDIVEQYGQKIYTYGRNVKVSSMRNVHESDVLNAHPYRDRMSDIFRNIQKVEIEGVM